MISANLVPADLGEQPGPSSAQREGAVYAVSWAVVGSGQQADRCGVELGRVRRVTLGARRSNGSSRSAACIHSRRWRRRSSVSGAIFQMSQKEAHPGAAP